MEKKNEMWREIAVPSFIKLTSLAHETNHRNPSKHRIEEHDMLNWVKHAFPLII